MVFGHVIEGQEVVREIENQVIDENSRPLNDVKITSCGELVLQVRPKGTMLVHKFNKIMSHEFKFLIIST